MVKYKKPWCSWPSLPFSQVDPALRLSTEDLQIINLRGPSAPSPSPGAQPTAIKPLSPKPPPLAKPTLVSCSSFGSTTSIRSSGRSSPIHLPLQHMDSAGSIDVCLGASRSPKSGSLSIPSSGSGAAPLFLERASSLSTSGASCTSPGGSNKGPRPRPHTSKQSSARTSLRAQTLLKLENNDMQSYTRVRNNNLRPMSPGTPDIASLGINAGPKKFFETDQEALGSPIGSSLSSELLPSPSGAGNVAVCSSKPPSITRAASL